MEIRAATRNLVAQAAQPSWRAFGARDLWRPALRQATWLGPPLHQCARAIAATLTRVVTSSCQDHLLGARGHYASAPTAARNLYMKEAGGSALRLSTQLWRFSHQAASSSAKSVQSPAIAGCERLSG